jgi:CheY-like chemotaxis protein
MAASWDPQHGNEFLAMLAHELRNPLAPIHNAVHVLRQRCPVDPETRWAHDVIERQVRHMARMVDDLLDVSRITQGKIHLRKRSITISEAITPAVEMVQPQIDERQQQLTVAQPPEAVWVDADLTRLAQVLANLLNNASKFSPKKAPIRLSVEKHGTEALIKVRDDGVGIAPAYLPRVFELFSQQDSSAERTHDGLGIGLALARNLVEMHGGRIEAHSEGLGCGSEFVVRLPILAAPSPAVGPTKNVEEKKRPRRILIVDDNVDGAKSLALLLKIQGHKIQYAHDGESALAIARKWSPEIVLLDIGLPRMNGLEVARRLRMDFETPQPYMIAVTGYGQIDDRKRSHDAGFDAHLVKPLELEELEKLLGEAPFCGET